MKKDKRVQVRRRVHVPSVYQIEASECGAACLSMILQYHGSAIPMEEIRYECGVSRDGCSAAGIVRAAGRFGLEAKGYRKTLDSLRQVPVPCILHWNFVHFVVLEGFGKNCVYISDPAAGKRKISMQELDDAFTGIVLCFEPAQNFEKRQQPSSLWKLIQKRLGQEKAGVLYLFLVGLLMIVPGMLLAMFTQSFVDEVLLQGNASVAKVLLLAIVFTYIFQILFQWIRSRVLARLRLKLSIRSNALLLYKMFRLPASFFDQRYAGELSQRLENNSSVNSFLAGNFSETLLNIIQAVFYLALMLCYNWMLALVGFIGVAANIIVSMLLLRPLASMNAKKAQDQGRFTGVLCAGISASSTIKASGVENEYVSEILNHYAQNMESEQKLGKVQQIVSAVPGSISNLFQVMVLVIGGTLVIRGACTAGMLTAFCQLLTSFVGPVNALIGILQHVQGMQANMARVEDIEAAKTDERYGVDSQSWDENLPAKLSGHIEARGLVFGYNPGLAPIVRNFSLRVQPGSRIAVVGASGCGKSTVGKMMSGLLVPWQGEILYDSIPLSRIPPEYLCSSLSVIGQNSAIFSGSIRDNLTFWRSDYSEQDLFRAVIDAQAYDMINTMPGAYDYVLDEGGRNLSGGQRQKLEIARALISDPSILIMDEATSALDAVTEKLIMDGIRRRGCTCLIIAHRLSTIRSCDLILVMDGGVVVECGSHEQLMQIGGHYAALVAEG